MLVNLSTLFRLFAFSFFGGSRYNKNKRSGDLDGCAVRARAPPPAGGVRAVGDVVRYKLPGPDTSWVLGVVVAAEERHVLVPITA